MRVLDLLKEIKRRYYGIKDIIQGLPVFCYNELQKSWDYLRTEDEMKNCENVSGPKCAGIKLLLSSNLLKQTLLYKG